MKNPIVSRHYFNQITKTIKNLLPQVLPRLLPNSCIFCHTPCKKSTVDICQHCLSELPWLEHTCYQCGNPMPPMNNSLDLCGSCLATPPYFDQLISLFHYHSPVNRMITSLKFSNQLHYAHLFAALLMKKLQQTAHYQLPEAIIPMPLHRKRLCERGFNQALEIAKPMAKALSIPIDINSCIRNKATEPQAQMHAKQRQQNLVDAFSIPSKLLYQHVAIVDDVVTTGTTVNELAKTLRKAGVHQIDVWCCARTSY